MLLSQDELTAMIIAEAATVTDVSVTEKPWGRELSFMLGNCLIKFIVVNAGFRTSLQWHADKEETIIILTRGEGGGIYGGATGEDLLCNTGSINIKPRTIHRTVGPVALFEVQTNFPNDVIRISDDYGRTT